MLLVIYFTFVGLVIGSAINAFVWRLYVGRKWTKGRSMCPECEHELAAKDLIPVVSWLWLRGKCRYCRAPIKDSPIVELASALLFGLSTIVLAPVSPFGWLMFALWLVLLTMLIILSVYDLRWLILPDKVMLPAVGMAAVIAIAYAVHAHSLVTFRGPLVAAILTGGAFYALVAFTKGRAMGGGDIKFVFMMGLLLGLRGTLLALLIAFDAAALIALALIALKLRGRRDQIAFGPFLAGGTVIAFLYGHQIIEWYLRLNGLS